MTKNIPNIKFFAFSILVSLVLSACTLEFNTTIQPDGSGELKVEFGLGPEEQVEAQSTAVCPGFCPAAAGCTDLHRTAGRRNLVRGRRAIY